MITGISLGAGSVFLETPAYFPSVSTVKTSLRPDEYVRLLVSVGGLNGNLLVSAYDLYHAQDSEKENIRILLRQAIRNGLTVLLDSGNYESYWKASKWDQQSYLEVLKQFDYSIAFSFDDQPKPLSISGYADHVYLRHSIDQQNAGPRLVIPIIHASPSDLPLLCVNVAHKTGVNMVAIPERRLGDGIFERVNTLCAIREALGDIGRYIGIHLLGTGNPFSIAIYSLYGANSFDGLEWCQTVVDYNTGALFHFSQADFFSRQTCWGGEDLPFQLRTILHNLQFYNGWMKRLRNSIHDDKGKEFCEATFPHAIFHECVERLGW